MPEASELHSSGPSTIKALGPQQEVSGNVATSEVNASSVREEPSRTTNAPKARKRTKTGCLSKSSLVTDSQNSRITHTSQHAASGALSAARSAQLVKTVSSPSASAKATFPELSSRILLVLSGQRSRDSLLALKVFHILKELQTSMEACL